MSVWEALHPARGHFVGKCRAEFESQPHTRGVKGRLAQAD